MATEDEAPVEEPQESRREDARSVESPPRTIFYRWIARHPALYSCLHRYPRTSALLLGVVVPLWALLLWSCLFGYPLATVEAPYETEANNAILRAERVTSVSVLEQFATHLPPACVQLLHSNQTVDGLEDILRSALLGQLEWRNASVVENSTCLDWNTVRDFADACGRQASTFADRFVPSSSETTALSFAWIRCANVTIADWHRQGLRPEAQAQAYRAAWNVRGLFVWNVRCWELCVSHASSRPPLK